MKEILLLVIEVILLILKGFSAKDATESTASAHGIAFVDLWNALPKRWK